MHRLTSSFVLAYHGCSHEAAERLLKGERFRLSENDYDWLGSGAYFWEANPDRALMWAAQAVGSSKARSSATVGAVIDLGFCLDLMSSNGTNAVDQAYKDLVAAAEVSGSSLPVNRGGKDLLRRTLDRAVIEYLHAARKEDGKPPFETVRALFPESEPLFPGSGFLAKTHIQICVRNPDNIKGVFRVPKNHFSEAGA